MSEPRGRYVQMKVIGNMDIDYRATQYPGQLKGYPRIAKDNHNEGVPLRDNHFAG